MSAVKRSEMRVPAKSDGMTSRVFWRQSFSNSARSSRDRLGLVGRIGSEQVVAFGRVRDEVVQFAAGPRAQHLVAQYTSGWAVGDIPRQVQQWPRRIILDIAVFLCADGTNGVERIVIGLRGVDLRPDLSRFRCALP